MYSRRGFLYETIPKTINDGTAAKKRKQTQQFVFLSKILRKWSISVGAGNFVKPP